MSECKLTEVKVDMKLAGSIVVLRPAEFKEFPFFAFFVKDDEDLQQRLNNGELKEGDIVITTGTAVGEIVYQNPLKVQWETP